MEAKKLMEEKDAELLVDRIAEKVAERLESSCATCGITEEEQEEVKSLLRTKKSSVRVFLWIIGALAVWILKDVYTWIAGHLTIR